MDRQKDGRIPFEGVLALRSEVVHVGLEVQLEHVVLVDVLRLGRHCHRVAQQGKAGQGVVVLQWRKGSWRLACVILAWPGPFVWGTAHCVQRAVLGGKIKEVWTRSVDFLSTLPSAYNITIPSVSS